MAPFLGVPKPPQPPLVRCRCAREGPSPFPTVRPEAQNVPSKPPSLCCLALAPARQPCPSLAGRREGASRPRGDMAWL